MSKTYYQKNKNKWKKYYQNQINDPKKHRLRIKKTKQWKLDNPLKTKKQKRKDDAKYYEKKKTDPKFKKKRSEYGKEYYKKNKERHNRTMKLHRAKPEVKKKNAEYNKKYQEENPEVILRNIRNHLSKLGAVHNMDWHQFLDQLRGWARIIHKDHDERCAVCGEPSQEAHHILHKSKYPNLAFNRNNGIALCVRCHNQSHGKMMLVNI